MILTTIINYANYKVWKLNKDNYTKKESNYAVLLSREGGLAANSQCGVSLPQGDGQALEQVVCRFMGWNTQTPPQKATDAGDGAGGFVTPPTQGLHHKGNKKDTHSKTGLNVGIHLSRLPDPQSVTR